MKELKGRVAAITGAASGIGRALAMGLASSGCSVAISDIDEAGLEETSRMAAGSSVKVTTHRIDVAKREEVYRFADEVVEQHGGVNIIINNAGVVVTQSLEDVTYEDYEWIMGINLWGVIYGTKAFLPYLRQQPEGHIVNISSVNGIFANPNNGPYCSTKFAVRGFTEALRQELRKTTVRVSCVHPGGVKTDIVRSSRFYKGPDHEKSHDETVALFDRWLAPTTPEKAARIIIKGIKKNKKRIMVGPDAYFYDLMARLFPVQYTRLISLIK